MKMKTKLSMGIFIVAVGLLPTMAVSGWCDTCDVRSACPLPVPPNDEPWLYCGSWDDDEGFDCFDWYERQRDCGFWVTGWEYKSEQPLYPAACGTNSCL